MLMADTFAIVFSIIGFLLALQGLWLLCYGLWPARVQAALPRVTQNRIKSVLLGIPVTLVMVLATAIFGGAGGPGGQTIAFGIVCVWVLYSSIGVASLAMQIGGQLSAGRESSPWRTIVRGGTALELAFLFPILGWFLLLPLAHILGCGAVSLSFFRRRKPAAAAAPASEAQLPIAPAPRAEAFRQDRQPVEAVS
jgi:hypothetical protein